MDIIKLAEEVRMLRRKLVDDGKATKNTAFDVAFYMIASQYSDITPENWRNIKSEAGRLLAKKNSSQKTAAVAVRLLESRSKKILTLLVGEAYSFVFQFTSTLTMIEVKCLGCPCQPRDIPENIFSIARNVAEKYFHVGGVQQSLLPTGPSL